MTQEEVKFQVALSCIQGILEAKHGVLGEILPELAVKESLRIADEFVKQWFDNKAKNEAWNACDDLMLRSIIERGSVLIPMGEIALTADQVNWLKSLPERFNFQPKQRRSKEDERILTGIIGKIDHNQTYGVSKQEMLSFLESLRSSPLL